jgi:reverse gyrase
MTLQRQHLVIVESPANCQTIEKILKDHHGPDHNENNIHYTVRSCMGHIRDLSKSMMKTDRFPYSLAGVDLDGGDYTPDYTVLENKRHVVPELTTAAPNSDAILLATDPDRESEAMAWHLFRQLSRRISIIFILSRSGVCGLPKSLRPRLRRRSGNHQRTLICISSRLKKHVACWTGWLVLPCRHCYGNA